MTLPSASLGADTNTNKSLSTGVSADGNLCATAETDVDLSKTSAIPSSSIIGSFDADASGKSLNVSF